MRPVHVVSLLVLTTAALIVVPVSLYSSATFAGMNPLEAIRKLRGAPSNILVSGSSDASCTTLFDGCIRGTCTVRHDGTADIEVDVRTELIEYIGGVPNPAVVSYTDTVVVSQGEVERVRRDFPEADARGDFRVRCSRETRVRFR